MSFIRLIGLLLIGFLASCTQYDAKHISEPVSGTHIIGMKTGALGTTWKWNEDKFAAKATSLCGGGNYKVVEKETHPKALKDAGDLVEKYNFYWVVECLASK